MRAFLPLTLTLAIAACGGEEWVAPVDEHVIDAGSATVVVVNDAGLAEEAVDASIEVDSGQPDGGFEIDAGSPVDAGEPDSGLEVDAGRSPMPEGFDTSCYSPDVWMDYQDGPFDGIPGDPLPDLCADAQAPAEQSFLVEVDCDRSIDSILAEANFAEVSQYYNRADYQPGCTGSYSVVLGFHQVTTWPYTRAVCRIYDEMKLEGKEPATESELLFWYLQYRSEVQHPHRLRNVGQMNWAMENGYRYLDYHTTHPAWKKDSDGYAIGPDEEGRQDYGGTCANCGVHCYTLFLYRK